MGIGDSIGKAAENAMEDLAGTSKPTETAHVPEPTDPNDDVEVHSSISEGSNALEAEKQKAPGPNAGAAPAPASESPFGGDLEPDEADDDGRPAGSASAPEGGSAAPAGGSPASQHGVPGPGGLPESNPEELRADPSEGDQDPSTSTGRG
ncbi:hypothetical protein J2X12_001144 [Pseudarthrobacter oxydans]|uniref:Uncharacterized protein n=1 Tax=Pseudarthrobacter oxydans TaxID=1671 RepID=A0AAW8N804_PSEOX|nr:hypothetical protein [Pseudarthrobacter oxydans]MDR6791717.1 hypothetical protein [Pseudarthrobacter oxydans]MDR7163131.1 hypothetical protein [Pseudarthrobacter oxydans]